MERLVRCVVAGRDSWAAAWFEIVMEWWSDGLCRGATPPASILPVIPTAPPLQAPRPPASASSLPASSWRAAPWRTTTSKRSRRCTWLWRCKSSSRTCRVRGCVGVCVCRAGGGCEVISESAIPSQLMLRPAAAARTPAQGLAQMLPFPHCSHSSAAYCCFTPCPRPAPIARPTSHPAHPCRQDDHAGGGVERHHREREGQDPGQGG